MIAKKHWMCLIRPWVVMPFLLALATMWAGTHMLELIKAFHIGSRSPLVPDILYFNKHYPTVALCMLGLGAFLLLNEIFSRELSRYELNETGLVYHTTPWQRNIAMWNGVVDIQSQQFIMGSIFNFGTISLITSNLGFREILPYMPKDMIEEVMREFGTRSR